MDRIEGGGLSKQDSPDVLPSILKVMASHEISGFDSVEETKKIDIHETSFQFVTPSVAAAETEAAASPSNLFQSQRMHYVPIDMPFSPTKKHLHRTKGFLFRDHDGEISNYTGIANSTAKQAKFHSQPMPASSALDEAVATGLYSNSCHIPPTNPKNEIEKDKRFDAFKTWSGNFERQLSIFRGRPREKGEEANAVRNTDVEHLPIQRYLDALEGPELDTLRSSEEILLPEDERWPFLLRFPISSFGICLGCSSQAIMWKHLAISPSTKYLHISMDVNLVLWCIASVLVALVSVTYILKVIFYFEAVRREYYHPIRVNYFFAPWITLLFLVLGIPPSIAEDLHPVLWYILMTPILFLELKIYGQWMSGGQRRLSMVANPTNHLSISGNFVGALAGATIGLKEGPLFFFAVGLAHFTVLFVTLYQRLPTNETLPKDLHPVYFMFVAGPSVASVAWARIQGSFGIGSRISYFIALFLYFSLACRVNFFRGIRFSLAWWAYTFPMTGAAIATIKYSNELPNLVTKCLTILLSGISTLVVTSLLVTTILHAFVLRDLFPNDMAIAISDKRPKTQQKWLYKRTGSPKRDIGNYLKFTDSDSKDNEDSVTSPSTITNGVYSYGTASSQQSV